MIELVGDLFSQQCDAIAITTNGMLNKYGNGIMGAGVAKQAATLFPNLPWLLGQSLKEHGNTTQILSNKQLRSGIEYAILSLPTKNHWRNPADLDLIEKSLKSLVEITNLRKWNKVILPRPGCGLGGLSWQIVKGVCETHLDDRFRIISP